MTFDPSNGGIGIRLNNPSIILTNIVKKMIQIMEGNREAYIRKIWKFLDSLPDVSENMNLFVEAYKSNIEK